MAEYGTVVGIITILALVPFTRVETVFRKGGRVWATVKYTKTWRIPSKVLSLFIKFGGCGCRGAYVSHFSGKFDALNVKFRPKDIKGKLSPRCAFLKLPPPPPPSPSFQNSGSATLKQS